AGTGELAIMPAMGDGGLVKLVTVQSDNLDVEVPLIQGLYVIFQESTLTPSAIIGGQELTALRTPAVSGLATRYMSTTDARCLVLFGAGVQARGHVAAMRAVRPIEEVIVIGRRDAATVDFVKE